MTDKKIVPGGQHLNNPGSPLAVALGKGMHQRCLWRWLHDDWKSVYDTYDEWGNLFASQSYVWNGSVWVETSDRASEIYQATRITETINQVEILAEAAAVLNDELIRTQASITVTNSSIAQEVLRATTAESSKIDKTSTYQTADSIVNAAKTYVNGILGNWEKAGIKTREQAKSEFSNKKAGSYNPNAPKKKASYDISKVMDYAIPFAGNTDKGDES